MRYIKGFVFVAALRDMRRLGSDRLAFCSFIKEATPQDAPQPGTIVNVGGVRFIYEEPRRMEDAVGYMFEPIVMARLVSVLGSAQLCLLTPEDHKKFAAVREALKKQGYMVVISDLDGRPFSPDRPNRSV
jgi:hypothetical protein